MSYRRAFYALQTHMSMESVQKYDVNNVEDKQNQGDHNAITVNADVISVIGTVMFVHRFHPSALRMLNLNLKGHLAGTMRASWCEDRCAHVQG